MKKRQSLLDAIADDRQPGAMFVNMLSLGLRKSETLGLKWSVVDREAGTLRVQRPLKRESGKIVLGELKTRRSAAPRICRPAC